MTPFGIEPATLRFVAQHLNHCATAVPLPHISSYASFNSLFTNRLTIRPYILAADGVV